ncbi:hypothetical protein PZH39_16045, partial [Desulfovibrio desulfuricans]|uniref:hypothetical protein n=1 Tax=Desulfovibrio desulfuricans TaxID=876 RepID=UPI0023B147FA
PQVEARRQKLDAALDDLRSRFGNKAVQRGRLFTPAEKRPLPRLPRIAPGMWTRRMQKNLTVRIRRL